MTSAMKYSRVKKHNGEGREGKLVLVLFKKGGKGKPLGQGDI